MEIPSETSSIGRIDSVDAHRTAFETLDALNNKKNTHLIHN